MSIKRYNAKRSFKQTPEPPGKTARGGTGALRFVVQKHAASHLHYDFRLELNGVLLSWAVPKGPSLNPDERRLAMHVEDHPTDYRGFEGIIPKGNYGAGTVMVWDEGTYAADPALGKAANVKLLTEAYGKGKLRFFLSGKKLRGEFALVRMRGKSTEDKAWLLIKADDAAADRDSDVLDQDRSAVSRRTLTEIAQNEEAAVWDSAAKKAAAKSAGKSGSSKTAGKKTKSVSAKGKTRSAKVKSSGGKTTKRKAMNFAQAALALGGTRSDVPDLGGPQLATLVDEPFDREGWIFEIKWDGYRALGYHLPGEGSSLVSRNGLSFDNKFADIRNALPCLPCAAVVDGEIVILDAEGRSSFGRLQQHEKQPVDLVYCLFDLLYVDGIDIREVPLLARKQLLQELVANCDRRIQYSDHVETHGRDFFEAARKNKLEGIIAKDAAAAYYPRRTRHWLKIKTEQRQEFVIAGYTSPRGSRTDIGSLVIGYWGKAKGKPTGKMCFAGHVGTGMDAATRALLKVKLDRLARKSSPFAKAPATNDTATWVEPQLVCEVRFSERTADGQLRHPVFIELREDKAASEIFWQLPAPTEAAVEAAEREDLKPQKAPVSAATNAEPAANYFGKEAPRYGMTLKVGTWDVPVSNPGRIYFPELKLTKLDVINYYRGVAPVLLPYLKDRPFVLHRFPRGIVHEGFYQKDNPQDLPSWIRTTEIHSESTGEDNRYIICDNEATLVYLINLGCLEMHAWNSRVQTIDKPDWMIFDLDPVDISFTKVVEAARVIHHIFEGARVPHYCKTSGKRGLHIAVPLGAKYTHETVREMAEAVAQLVHKQLPKSTSLERSPAKRRNKIYLDYLQNGFGKTMATPYSLRPVEFAGVSTPVHCDELTSKLDPRAFTLHSIQQRFERVGDLWDGVLKEGIDMRKLIKDAG